MYLKKLYDNDQVKVKEEKIKYLFFSNPKYLSKDENGLNFNGEEGELIKPILFFKKNTGRVIECDWDMRKKEWTYFVLFKDKNTKKEINLWFLESELNLI